MCQRRGITDAMPSHRVRCDRIQRGRALSSPPQHAR